MLAEIYQDVHRFKEGLPLEAFTPKDNLPDHSYTHGALVVNTWEGLDAIRNASGYGQRFVDHWTRYSQELIDLWRGKVRNYLHELPDSQMLGNVVNLGAERMSVRAVGDSRAGNVTIRRDNEEETENDYFHIYQTILPDHNLMQNGRLTIIFRNEGEQKTGDKYDLVFRKDHIAVMERSVLVTDPTGNLPSWRFEEKRNWTPLCDRLASAT